jgi:translation initiation factor 2 subunit 2
VCKTCKSPDTLLNKENRLYFITCESCGSRESTHAHLLLSLASSPLIDTFHLFPGRSVAAIKTGFQAQVGRRIKPAA